METKSLFNLLLLTALTVPTIKADFFGRFGDKSKAVGSAMAAGIIYHFGNKNQAFIAKCEPLAAEKVIGTIASTIAFGSACESCSYAASYFEKKKLSKLLKNAGIQNLPETAGSVFLTGNGKIKKWVSSIPVIKDSRELQAIAWYAGIKNVIKKAVDLYRSKNGKKRSTTSPGLKAVASLKGIY